MYRIHRTAIVLAGVAVGALTLAGCGSTSMQADSAPLGGCALQADLVNLPGAAAGTTYWDVVVTDTGKAACTLPAQPSLAVLGPDHEQLPVTVHTDPTAKPFPLAPGASAAQAVGYGTDGNPPCDTETAYLRVTPPGVDLPFRPGAQHCGADTVTTGSWVAGNHAAPQ